MSLPRSYLVVFNVAKRQNIGQLIRTADALGCAEVIVVGRKKARMLGAFGTDDPGRRRHFYSLDEAVAWLRGENVAIVGIEIADGARAVDADSFEGDTAFLVGNEGSGLNTRQLAVCDRFVYVPQFGHGASLNVNVAAGIVLHRFASWAGRRENARCGQKFLPATARSQEMR